MCTDPDKAPVYPQTLDKLGKTARRTVDTHIKNSLSKPRLATCISRMTALFNFLQDLREYLVSSYLIILIR